MKSFLIVLAIVLGAFFVIGFAILNFNSSSPKSLQFSPTQLPAATVGQPYDVGIDAVGNAGPLDSVAVIGGSQNLPEGLQLDVTTDDLGGVTSTHIRGTPTTRGTTAFAIEGSTPSRSVGGFTIAGQSGQQQYTIVVN